MFPLSRRVFAAVAADEGSFAAKQDHRALRRAIHRLQVRHFFGETLELKIGAEPGDPLTIPAATFNTFVDSAKDFLARRHDQFQESRSKDATAKAIMKKPVAAYVEKVYEEGDFASLGIGTYASEFDGVGKMTPYQSCTQGKATVEFVEQDRGLVPQVVSSLNQALERLSEYFGIQDVPPIRTILTPNRNELDRCIREILRIEIEVPSNPVRVAQPQRTDLILLSPAAWEKDLHDYTPAKFGRLIAHEVAHIIEEHLSPNIEAVPRWWSEGLAMYTSGQWQERDTIQRVWSSLEANAMPSISQMQDGPITSQGVKLCYTWGWSLVMYVDRVIGRDMVIRVVRECRDGDVLRILGQSQQSLEAGWKEWLNRLPAAELPLLDDAD